MHAWRVVNLQASIPLRVEDEESAIVGVNHARLRFSYTFDARTARRAASSGKCLTFSESGCFCPVFRFFAPSPPAGIVDKNAGSSGSAPAASSSCTKNHARLRFPSIFASDVRALDSHLQSSVASWQRRGESG